MSSSSSSQSDNSSMNDVLLYAQSRLTRKQAVREIGEIVLRSNMKPRTVKQALQLIKAILPPDNTLPNTVQELFGAMLSSENDWRLAQYLIRHKQQPSFSTTSSSLLWNSNNSVSNPSSSTSFPSIPTSLIFPDSSSSESESDHDNASASSNSDSDTNSDGDDDDDDDEEEEDEEATDENNFIARLERLQQEESAPSSTVIQQPPTRVVTDDSPRPSVVIGNSTILPTEQRSQIASNPLNRFAFLGSFKRQRSESSSSSEPCLYNDLQLSSGESDDDDDDDDENSFYSLNNNPQSNSSNLKSRCFEMNGYDLLDGGRKRHRH